MFDGKMPLLDVEAAADDDEVVAANLSLTATLYNTNRPGSQVHSSALLFTDCLLAVQY